MPDTPVIERAWQSLCPPVDEDGSPESTVLRSALYALAHAKAWDHRTLRAIDPQMPKKGEKPSQEVADAIRANNRANLLPFTMGFAVAALIKGWETEQINDTLTNSADTAREYLWDWVTEAGVDPVTIASADDPITTGQGLTAEAWRQLRDTGQPAGGT